MIQAYIATDLIDAEMVAAELMAAGVAAVVQGDILAIPSGPFPTVWVADESLELAREILAAREAEKAPTDPGA